MYPTLKDVDLGVEQTLIVGEIPDILDDPECGKVMKEAMLRVVQNVINVPLKDRLTCFVCEQPWCRERAPQLAGHIKSNDTGKQAHVLVFFACHECCSKTDDHRAMIEGALRAQGNANSTLTPLDESQEG